VEEKKQEYIGKLQGCGPEQTITGKMRGEVIVEAELRVKKFIKKNPTTENRFHLMSGTNMPLVSWWLKDDVLHEEKEYGP